MKVAIEDLRKSVNVLFSVKYDIEDSYENPVNVSFSVNFFILRNLTKICQGTLNVVKIVKNMSFYLHILLFLLK